MSDDKKSFIGKYVCYDAIDGGACWGRIKAECKINTMGGEREAFILEGRVVAHHKARVGVTVKFMPPGGDIASKTMALDPETGQMTDEIEMSVTHVKGDTLVRKDVLNLETDIIEVNEDSMLAGLSDELIFMSLLKGRAEGALANKAIQLGLVKLLGMKNIRQELREELLKRIDKRSEENGGRSETGSDQSGS